MNILITYATNSGGTLTAIQLVADHLNKSGHTATLQDAKNTTADQVLAAEAVVFASPSWDYENQEGQPHEDFFPLMGALTDKTANNKPFAILGLGDSSYSHFCGAVPILETLVQKMGGKLIVPSLKIDGFFYDQEKNMKLVEDWSTTLTQALTS
jgi:flavodoxin